MTRYVTVKEMAGAAGVDETALAAFVAKNFDYEKREAGSVGE